MTSTFSTNLNLQYQGTGDNVNTWGALLNTTALANIDQALGSPYAANVAGSSDVTLSTTNALNLVHNLTGVLTGNINYIFPSGVGRLLSIYNNTSGAFSVTVKSSGGTGVAIPQGTRQLVLIDSSNSTAYLSANLNSVLSNTLTSAHIFVGNGSAVATDVAVSGDLTLANTGAFTIANNAVTNAKAAQMIAHTYKGNNTGSTANAADITSTQLTADLNLFTSSLQGLVPASSGGTTNFLRADGSFAVPSTGSAPILLSSQTASNAGTLSFAGFMSSTYPIYKIYLYNVYGASAAALWARYGISGSYISSSTYNGSVVGRDSGGNPETVDISSAAQFTVTGASLSATAGDGGAWEFTIYNPSHSSAITWCDWKGNYKVDSAARYVKDVGGGANTGTSAITDIQFLMSTGNINAIGRMYGLP